MTDDIHELWPEARWRELVRDGVLGWCIPAAQGGAGLPADELLERNVELARAGLGVAFILSQFQAACHRLVDSGRFREWLPRLARGEAFATVGISHLTTSRQHVATPAVRAEPCDGGYRLTGEVPWVTGAAKADLLVTGATLADGQQVLVGLPCDRDGIDTLAPVPLLALNESLTGPVRLSQAFVGSDEILAGPQPQALKMGGSIGAGSLTTSGLALGHAMACLDRLREEAVQRDWLADVVHSLEADGEELRTDLRTAARGTEGAHPPEVLRTRATQLALDASQAYLTAAKGAGFVAGHPASRLCREALFFLVWSCPQPVATRLLREFSRCDDA